MKDREFTIENGYQILICFMPEFWWNCLKGVMIEKGLITDGMTPEELEQASAEEKVKHDIYSANSFVFDTVTSDLGGCGDYLEDIIEEKLGIPPKKQHEGLRVNEVVLFQLVIDLCHYFKKKFQGPPKDYAKDSLDFAIEWLEEMRKHPKQHQKEWDMWEASIENILSGDKKWCYSAFSTHITGENP